MGHDPTCARAVAPGGAAGSRTAHGVRFGEGGSRVRSGLVGVGRRAEPGRTRRTRTGVADRTGNGMAGERTVCERDGDAWYRAGGGRHEYALVEKGHVLKVSGDSTKVTRAVCAPPSTPPSARAMANSPPSCHRLEQPRHPWSGVTCRR